MDILEYAFAGANIKPTIHIESWKTNNHQVTTYGTVLQSMGCLSKLKSLGYRLLPWDWESFHEENKSTSCNHYTNNLQLNYVYAAEKETLKNSLPFITGSDFINILNLLLQLQLKHHTYIFLFTKLNILQHFINYNLE